MMKATTSDTVPVCKVNRERIFCFSLHLVLFQELGRFFVNDFADPSFLEESLGDCLGRGLFHARLFTGLFEIKFEFI